VNQQYRKDEALEIRAVEWMGEEILKNFNPKFRRPWLFRCSKKMPHYSSVRSSWERACVECSYRKYRLRVHAKELLQDEVEKGEKLYPRMFASFLDSLSDDSSNLPRRGRPKSDKWSDCLILAIWLHLGMWMFNHEDRGLFVRSWFYPPHQYQTEALRKRVKKLGLLGWNDFPQTYPKAPLHTVNGAIWVSSGDWLIYFS
jgi:hypothetical protein